MKKAITVLLAIGSIIGGIILLNLPMLTKASEANHVVISEVKITGGTGKTADEFVELYNPTDQTIGLSGWQLVKKTASGSSYILVDNFGEREIRSHSFFLVAHPVGYLGETQPDFYYTTTNSVADNNTVVLLNDVGQEIDKVGFGTATDFEGTAALNPGANKSLERKALADSVIETMVEGGPDYFLGNGKDTDDNEADFILRGDSEPQNSTSELEYRDIIVPDIPEPPVEEPTPSPPPPSAGDEPAPPIYSDKIKISEVFPNPAGRDEGEFVELLNSGTAEVDLADWYLGDMSSRRYKIDKSDFTSTIIEGGAHFVLKKEVSGVSLNNTEDAAKLYYPDGTLVDAVEYGDCQEGRSYSLIGGKWAWTDQITAGQTNKLVITNELPLASFEIEGEVLKAGQPILFDASDSSDVDGDTLTWLWDFGDGTKADSEKAEHVFQQAGNFTVRLTVADSQGGEDEAEQMVEITDYDYSSLLVINELLPACQGPDEDCEYVELYNPENRAVKLDGWRLMIKKSTYTFPSGAEIKARGYFVVERKDNRLPLNNAGAVVYLVDPRGKIINGVEYGKAKDDLSFSRIDSRGWQWTEKQTPGGENEFSQEGGEELEELQDERVIGEEDKKAQKAPQDLSAVITPIAEVTEDKLGSVLKVSAEVESVSGSNIYLTDEDGNTLRVYIQKATGIKKPALKAGDTVEVVGLLDKTAAGLRLLPRKQEDIRVLPKENGGQVLGASVEKQQVIDVPIKDRSKQVKTYLLVGAGVLATALVVIVVKKRADNLKFKNQNEKRQIKI